MSLGYDNRGPIDRITDMSMCSILTLSVEAGAYGGCSTSFVMRLFRYATHLERSQHGTVESTVVMSVRIRSSTLQTHVVVPDARSND